MTNQIAQAIPDNLYGYSDATTQANGELQAWIRNVLSPVIALYTDTAVDFGNDIPDLTLQRPGPSGSSIDADVRFLLDAAFTTDKHVHAVGQAFQAAGNSQTAMIPPGLPPFAPGGPFRYAIITLPDGGPLPPASCPTGATCSDVGAFQANVANDYKTMSPLDLTDADYQRAAEIVLAMRAAGLKHAADFFQHYIDATGTDLRYDAMMPYCDSPNFQSTVNGTVQQYLLQAERSGATTFDSGYLDYTFKDNYDWKNAVGHGYYRVVGHQNPDGSWSVTLQLTSYYQFRPDGPDFKKSVDGFDVVDISQKDMRNLERAGAAQNFRSIGTGTLTYDADGNRVGSC